MTEKDIINYNTVLNSPVDEAMVTAIVNETIIDKNEPEADILTNTTSTPMIDPPDHTEKAADHDAPTDNTQVKAPKKSKAGSGGSFKRRKTMKRRDEPLHPDLQACIIPNFHPVNATTLVTKQAHNIHVSEAYLQ
jgi:hypothetical protein